MPKAWTTEDNLLLVVAACGNLPPKVPWSKIESEGRLPEGHTPASCRFQYAALRKRLCGDGQADRQPKDAEAPVTPKKEKPKARKPRTPKKTNATSDSDADVKPESPETVMKKASDLAQVENIFDIPSDDETILESPEDLLMTPQSTTGSPSRKRRKITEIDD